MSELDEQRLVHEVLLSIKRFFKFKELERVLNISVPTLWRYIHGDIRPSAERSRQILLRLLNSDIINNIRDKAVKVVGDGIINVYALAYDINILTLASTDAALWARDLEPSAVVTVETDGIPLATLIAKRLSIKLVTVKKKKEVGFDRFTEVSYVTRAPPEVVTLYIPEGLLEQGDKVLVVDDLVRSGRTSAAVFELVRKVGAKTRGYYALVSVGEEWRPMIERYVGNNYRSFFHIPLHLLRSSGAKGGESG